MRRRFYLVVVLSSILCLLSLHIGDAVAKYEEPIYKVLKKDGNIEVRAYGSSILASVTIEGSRESSANSAFKILAAYIFGKNSSQAKITDSTLVTNKILTEKIPMTIPVTTKLTPTTLTMSFFMPTKYTLETIPEPEDKRILVNQISPTQYAVIKFSGMIERSNINKHESILQNYIKEKNLKIAGQSIRAFYNPPWTLPFLRRNEIWIPLEHLSE